jgi:MATE family multidrug resistance protein
VKYSFAWGLGIGILFSLAYLILPEQVIGLFTNKTEVIQLALSLMIWTQFAPIFSSFCYIWDGIYIGATATKAMRNMMLLSMLVFYLPVYYLFGPLLGHHTLWLALSVFMIARGITLTALYKKEILARIA